MESVTQSQPDSSGRQPRSSFLSRHGAKILALVPLIFLIWVVTQYAVAVPYWDQWELVPLLEKTYHGDLTLHDLWAQHNEHRILFPQIIMLVLARLTHWNTHYELAVNLILAVGIFAVFARQVKQSARKLGRSGLSWAIPAISVVVFSVSQYQNWLWGWQLQMFLNALAVMGGIGLLAGNTFRWHRFATAALLGIVATYSFANGMLVWPIGLGVLLTVTIGARERKAGIFGWIFIATLTLGTYFYHYHQPADHPPLNLIFKMPFEYAAYVFKYLGGIGDQGLSGDDAVDATLAGCFGLAGTLALGWAGWMLVRKNIAPFRTLVPYFAMSLYSIGSALLTGIGRLGFGSNQALCSRYGTMVTPLWVSLIVFLALLAGSDANAGKTDFLGQQRGLNPWPWNSQVIARWSLWGVITLLMLNSVFAVAGARNLSQLQAYGRARLLELAANPGADFDYNSLTSIYPRPKVVVERYPILVQHRLSAFRDQNRPVSP